MSETIGYGDEVTFKLGGRDIHATVREVYGTPPKVMVVLDLTPELSDYIVDKPTTQALPIDEVTKVASAA